MTKTICHWFLQSTGPLFNGNYYSKKFLFKPPENIAGKVCLFKLNNVALSSQLPMPVSIYMKGLTFPQNACIDPSFSSYGEISPTTFYQLVGDENRSQLIGNIGAFPTTAVDDEMPYLLVYIPPGPTFVELGLFTNNEVESDTWRQSEFPPGALSSNSQTFNVLRRYGNGIYTVSVSGPNGLANVYELFDKVNTTGGSIGDGYQSNTGVYIGNIYTTVGNTNIYGAYVQLYISVPYPIFRIALNKRSNNSEPRRITVVGSTNNQEWAVIYTSDQDIVFPAGSNSQVTIDIQQPDFAAISYLYWRIIVTEIGNTPGAASTNCDLTEIRCYANIQSDIPPAALITNPTTLTGQNYMNGTYTVSISGPGGTATPQQLFDTNTATNNNIGTGYIAPSGAYTGTEFTVDQFTGTTYFGAYATIELPKTISIQSYRFVRVFDSNRPRRFVILGSNDNIKYYMVHDNSTFDASWSSGIHNRILEPFNGKYYRFYRILATEIGLTGVGGTTFALGEIILYGNNSAWTGNAHFITEIEPIDALENK